MEFLSLWRRVLSCEKSLAATSEERQLYSQTGSPPILFSQKHLHQTHINQYQTVISLQILLLHV